MHRNSYFGASIQKSDIAVEFSDLHFQIYASHQCSYFCYVAVMVENQGQMSKYLKFRGRMGEMIESVLQDQPVSKPLTVKIRI